ncbi:hypothetical protein LCGC14_1894950 [marine sediment metagenome]|uniref:Uncharacterized protein n=1 Tax=marine sediment metagenome TaxID=412755 RepID=A0A0F9GLP3_9ZZZZ
MTPDPTDAELDEIEVLVNRWRVHREGDMHNMAGRLIKALRACRQQSKAKDAVVETARRVLAAQNRILDDPPPIKYRAAWRELADLRQALTALDKEAEKE